MDKAGQSVAFAARNPSGGVLRRNSLSIGSWFDLSSGSILAAMGCHQFCHSGHLRWMSISWWLLPWCKPTVLCTLSVGGGVQKHKGFRCSIVQSQPGSAWRVWNWQLPICLLLVIRLYWSERAIVVLALLGLLMLHMPLSFFLLCPKCAHNDTCPMAKVHKAFKNSGELENDGGTLSG